MQNIKSGKLIEHIADAKDWLDKAETEYSHDNPVQGELILNLAQAEVKHAWELSRSRCVIKGNSSLTSPDKRVYLIPLAASFILVLSLIFGSQLGSLFTNSSSSNAVSKKIAKSVQKVPEININPVQSEPKLVIAAPKQFIAKEITGYTPVIQSEKIVKIEPVKVVEEKPVTDNTIVVDNNQSGKPVASRESVLVQQGAQPVSQLQIDEEALTREATRSLRNGK